MAPHTHVPGISTQGTRLCRGRAEWHSGVDIKHSSFPEWVTWNWQAVAVSEGAIFSSVLSASQAGGSNNTRTYKQD